jgi:HEAT repeat protein
MSHDNRPPPSEGRMAGRPAIFDAMTRLAGLALALGLLLRATPAAANFDWVGRVELDAQDLANADVKKRLEAVGNLSAYDPALTAPHLLRALHDSERSVRLEAARVLGRGAVPEVVPVMMEWLADPIGDVRGVAAEVLGDVGGDDATASLIRTLGDDDAAVRLRAVVALGKIGARGNPAVVIPLISRLEDDKPDVRRKAVEQLELLKDRRAVIPLVAAFGDTHPEVKKAAIRAVGQLGDTSAVSALLRLVNEPADEIRGLAVGALGAIGAPEAADTLIDLMPSGTPDFRAKVAFAIGQIAARPGAGEAAQRAVRALVEMLADPGQRAQAREALAVAGKAAVPPLIAHLDGKLAGDPVTAVALLEDSKDPRATDALVAELDRGRVPIPSILAALGGTEDPRALVPVLGTLSAKEPAVRLAAMQALRSLVGQDPRAADVLIERLADDDLEVRILAAEYLGLTQARGAVEKLSALTAAGSPPRLRRASIDALGEIGDPRGAPALIALLREGPSELHRAAVDALSYAADAKSVDALLALTRDDRGATRYHLVRALGAVMRSHPDADAVKLLRQLADGATTPVSLAAISALAAANARDATGLLRDLLDKSGSDRRRAAALALGELAAIDAVPNLVAALAAKDDRVAADAAWALGEIAASGAEGAAAVVKGDQLPILFRLARRGGWAASISATGALARIAAVSPAAVVAHRDLATQLLHHKSRLVRVNAAHLVAELERGGKAPTAAAVGALVTIVDDDASPGARLAAIRALATIAGGKPARLGTSAVASLDLAAGQTRDPAVAAAAVAAKKAAPPAIARSEWRSFYVVDPSADDRPVRQEAYFIVGDDQLIWATYTDARGEIATEHFPAGDATVLPASREDEL